MRRRDRELARAIVAGIRAKAERGLLELAELIAEGPADPALFEVTTRNALRALNRIRRTVDELADLIES